MTPMAGPVSISLVAKASAFRSLGDAASIIKVA